MRGDIEPLPPGVAVVGAGQRQMVVGAPDVRNYGHQAIETLYALGVARALGRPLILLRPRTCANEGLFEIDVDGVRVVRSLRWRAAARTAAAVTERGRRARSWRNEALEEIRREARTQLGRYREQHPQLPRSVRHHLKRVRHGLAVAPESTAAGRDWPRPYWRRRLVLDPLPAHMTRRGAQRAAAAAARVGIDLEAKFVTLHVRERGYKIGREFQDAKGDPRDDSTRNARIETHFDAIDLLVERGYTVVRIGDPSMTRVSRAGVVDLATSPHRDPVLEVECIFRSEFLVCGESGPLSVAYLTNTPMLTLNATDPIGAFPVRDNQIYLLKNVTERATGEPLTPPEMLSERYLGHLREPWTWIYRENTSEEISSAVREMLDLVEGAPPSDAQRRYADELTALAIELKHLPYVRKWGADEGFLGEGRLARSQARHWEAADASEDGTADARATSTVRS